MTDTVLQHPVIQPVRQRPSLSALAATLLPVGPRRLHQPWNPLAAEYPREYDTLNRFLAGNSFAEAEEWLARKRRDSLASDTERRPQYGAFLSYLHTLLASRRFLVEKGIVDAGIQQVTLYPPRTLLLPDTARLEVAAEDPEGLERAVKSFLTESHLDGRVGDYTLHIRPPSADSIRERALQYDRLRTMGELLALGGREIF